jgi:hypothetical protein
MIVPASSIQPTSIKDDNRGSHLLLYQQRRMSFLWRQRASSLTADEEVDKCGLRTDPLTGNWIVHSTVNCRLDCWQNVQGAKAAEKSKVRRECHHNLGS